jgi:hypothetical protein
MRLVFLQRSKMDKKGLKTYNIIFVAAESRAHGKFATLARG